MHLVSNRFYLIVAFYFSHFFLLRIFNTCNKKRKTTTSLTTKKKQEEKQTLQSISNCTHIVHINQQSSSSQFDTTINSFSFFFLHARKYDMSMYICTHTFLIANYCACCSRAYIYYSSTRNYIIILHICLQAKAFAFDSTREGFYYHNKFHMSFFVRVLSLSFFLIEGIKLGNSKNELGNKNDHTHIHTYRVARKLIF